MRRPSSYRANAAYAAINRLAPIAVQLVAAPFIIREFGSAVFAIWALLATTMSLMLSADFGVVGLMHRYHSVAKVRNDERFAGRITVSVLLFLLVLLLVFILVGPAIANVLTEVFIIPNALRSEAWLVFRFTGPLAVIQLLGLALSAYLMAHQRFFAVAVSSIVARTIFALAIVFVLVTDSGLLGLLGAVALDAVASMTITAAASWRHLAFEARGLLSSSELRELWRYAWRNQISALGFIAQRESDILIAAFLLSPAYQATVAASVQLASAVVLAPSILLLPLFTNLSGLSERDEQSVVDATQKAESLWLQMLIPFGIVTVVVLPTLSSTWLAAELQDFVPVMTLMSFAFTVGLLNAVRATYVRAIALPGLEARSYLVMIIVKIALAIPLVLAFGVTGLVISTLLATAFAVFNLWKNTLSLLPRVSLPKLRSQSWFTSLLVLVISVGAVGVITAIVSEPLILAIALTITAITLFFVGFLRIRVIENRV